MAGESGGDVSVALALSFVAWRLPRDRDRMENVPGANLSTAGLLSENMQHH